MRLSIPTRPSSLPVALLGSVEDVTPRVPRSALLLGVVLLVTFAAGIAVGQVAR